MVEIMVVLGIIGMIAVIAYPSFVRARDRSRQKACINNLRQIDGAKEQWAMEENKVGTDAVVLDELDIYLQGVINLDIACPADGMYDCNTVEGGPTCDYIDPEFLHVLPPN